MKKQKLIFLGTSWLLSANLSAQIATDGSLGPVQDFSKLGPDYQIGNDLGQQRGGNLFHSFEKFNLHQGQSATFFGPDNIQNVISRVTGGNPSDINGLIRSTMPKADFYFLNPYGIIFGSDARLDVQGSFHASTADSLRFIDGSSFSATENVSHPILTVASPEAFGFLDTPGKLSLDGSFFELKENQTLFLLGSPLTITNATLFAPYGDINLVGLKNELKNELQIINSTVYAPGGRISLLATALQKVIPTSFERLAADDLIEGGVIKIVDYSPEYPEREKIFSDHVASSPALQENLDLRFESPEDVEIANIDTSDIGGGKIVIRAGKFFLEEGSIYADNEADNEGGVDGGGIDIEVKGDMLLTKSAIITASAYYLGENVRGGDISIKAGKLEMSQMSIGLLFSMVDEWIDELEKITEYPTENFEQDFGVDKQTYFQEEFGMNEEETSKFLTNLGVVLSELEEQGRDKVSLDMIGNQMDEIDENEIDKKNMLELFTQNFNTIGTSNFGAGSGGDVTINTSALSIQDGLIETTTEMTTEENDGVTGGINIEENNGVAGNININAQQIQLSDYALIDASTVGLGQAGNITISENENLSLSNFGIISTNAFSSTFTTTSPDSIGKAGNIVLNTKKLTLNLGQINSFSEGYHHAGAINITADVVKLSNKSGIQTQAKNAGGGNITFNITDNLDVTDNSWITAEALGTKSQDSGGNITIGKKLSSDPDAPWENTEIFTLKNSKLLANAYAGNGGEINILTDDFQGENSEVDVSSRFGLNGNFYFNRVLVKNDYLIPMKPISALDKLESNHCLTLSELSQFLVRSRDALPHSPGNLNSYMPFVDD